MNKQVYNPFLPLWEYVPDGEPHVFGDRLYLFGSHDTEGGDRYCSEGNYVGWSAPVDDLSDWRYEGVIYEAGQDPRAHEGFADLYAPDVVRGNDGRYYLYYCISGTGGAAGEGYNTAIGVAVCDTPAGKYQYYGFVKNPDGSPFLKYLPADPAVINDDGVIRLYYGWAFSLVAAAAHGQGGRTPDLNRMSSKQIREMLLQAEEMLFHRTREQLISEPEDVMGANTAVLNDDMVTVNSEPKRIVPSQFLSYGTCFEGHGFYEASSIRKIGDTYYFIYSDENSNMLSYATSRYPDREFVYRGILQSNGDVGLNGRKGGDRLNMTANNHGSIECVNGQWYVFYHRQTHNSTFSRQACAEKILINSDGSIPQAECTSCGLNAGPLRADGDYPAVIACNITNGHMPHATNRVVNADIPFVTHSGTGKEAERYITNIKSGTRLVFKYFAYHGNVKLSLTYRGGGGRLMVFAGGDKKGEICLPESKDWQQSGCCFEKSGTASLELRYTGEGAADLKTISFEET